MLQVAERILRRNPKHVTFLGPLVTYTMTLMLGTGHAVYTIMPIIGDVALKNNIRPERPMAAASVASQLGITANPISVAVVYYLSQMINLPEFSGLSLINIVAVTIPATFTGLIVLSLYSMRRGKELDDDPLYQERLKDPIWAERIKNTTSTTLDESLPATAKRAVLLFILALVVIIFIAVYPEVRTLVEGKKPVSMSVIIQMIMLAFARIILIATKTHSQTVPNGMVFKSGIVAAIAIFGIAWMSDTYFQYAMPSFKAGVTGMVESYPWAFAFALFAVSVVINSQAATARMMLPVGLALGLPVPLLIGLMPATYGYFFIPNYPSDIATINFDISGTTKIGKFYFNYSFMMPGLFGVVTSCIAGYFLAYAII